MNPLAVVLLTLLSSAVLAVLLWVCARWGEESEPVPVDPDVFLSMERIRAKRRSHTMKGEIDRNLATAQRQARARMREVRPR